MTLEEWLGKEELPQTIWKKKYCNEDETLDEWFKRVSNGNQQLMELIVQKKFLFGGRILANRGVKNKKLSLSNCYVLSSPEDNLESIFDIGSKMARTYSYGGGCGVDISNLRPKGAEVNNAAKTTSGAVSFMDFYSHVTGLICQEGRRGALLISIDCNHPDIVDFINLKSDLDVCTKANISIRVTDEFMRAVVTDEDYCLRWPCGTDLPDNWKELEYNKLYSYMTNGELSYIKRIRAREVFKLLAQRNWEMAEPGLLFWDRISNYNLLQNTEFRYSGLNPCATAS